MRFLALPANVLRCLGVFPLSGLRSRWTSWTFVVYQTTIFAFMLTFTVLMTVQLISATDLYLLARTIDMWTMYLSGLYKWCTMVVFYRDYLELIRALDRIQAQGSIAYGTSADRFTANYLKPTWAVCVWYLFSGLVAAIFVCTSPFVTYPKSDRSEFEYFNDPNSYPLCCWIPFAVNDYWTFSLLYASHCCAALLIATLYLSIDTFMFGAIYAVGGQIELLNTSIGKIENSLASMENSISMNQTRHFSKGQQTLFYSTLLECLKHDILILRFIKKLNTDFSSLIFVDYLHGITSLTFALFQLTISGGIGETVAVMIFILVSGSHQFLNNFFGQFILQKQLSTQSVLYNVPWLRANKKIRNLLTPMILRSTKPIFITGFYMYKLCNESFVSFLKALYTYYMVLRHIHTNDEVTVQ